MTSNNAAASRISLALRHGSNCGPGTRRYGCMMAWRTGRTVATDTRPATAKVPRRINAAVAAQSVALAVAALTVSAGPASASPTHRMTLLPNMHTCDFQLVTSPSGRPGARLSAEITADGRTAITHIDMFNGADNAQYVVRLIPAPHPPLGCSPGDPGITTGTLATDDFGTGSITLQAPIAPGATGMWIAVDLPSAHSQTPQEFFSSNYIARL